MKIIQTPARFYPYVGGVEQVVYNLSKELIKLGHQVKVICADEPSTGDNLIEGIEVKRLKYITKIANTNITLGLPQALLKEDFDIIHTHLPHPWSADCSGLISLIKKKPLVLTYYNDIVGNGFNYLTATIYNSSLLQLILKLSKKIIITQKNYLENSRYLKPYKEKVKVISCGICLDEFYSVAKQRSSQKNIFFLGLLDNFHRYKGLEYLIKALPLIKKEVVNVRLIVGGEGILKEEYKRLSDSLGLKECVDFVGFIPKSKMLDYYSSCDVFVLPSFGIQEGFGIVLLEAMACAKPVVTTDITGSAEDIQNTNSGIVVRPKDANSLADAIITILKDDNLSAQMGENARKLVEEKYSWKKIALEIERIYKDILF